MSSLTEISPAFIEVAHRIVWANVATVDRSNRPRSRVLHPIWEWDGTTVTGWIATSPTPTKAAHIAHSPFVSVGYWDAAHDVATAECRATWHLDDAACIEAWERFKQAPEPVGYDPAIVPQWSAPTAPEFAVLRLEPWHLRVMPGSMLLSGTGDLLTWSATPRA